MDFQGPGIFFSKFKDFQGPYEPCTAMGKIIGVG